MHICKGLAFLYFFACASPISTSFRAKFVFRNEISLQHHVITLSHGRFITGRKINEFYFYKWISCRQSIILQLNENKHISFILTYTFISIFYVQYKAYKVLILTVKLSEIVFEFNIIKMTCLVNLTLFSRKKIHAKLYDFFFRSKCLDVSVLEEITIRISY